MLYRLKSAWKPLSTTGALGLFTYFGVQASDTPLPGFSYAELVKYFVEDGHWGVLVGSLLTALGGWASIQQIVSAKPATPADVHLIVKPIADNVNDLSGQIHQEGEASDLGHATTHALIRADKFDQTVADIRAGAITPDKRAELVAALGLAVTKQENTSADIAASFANATADFAQSDSSVDRQAAIDIIGGREVEAADRLLADIDTMVAGQAERARRIGAILAPFNVNKAFKAYARAADLDPAHFWTWIELARLQQAIGSLAESRRCVDQAMQNATDDRERSIADNELGDVAVAQGDLAAARASFGAGLAIAERLAASDPGNSGWQRDLSVSHNKIGDVAVAQGDLAAARASFGAGLAIRERLAASDPGNSGWQRDLSVSHNKIGDVAVAQGDLAAARASFGAGLAIAERLAASDPGNSGWQRDLSVSHDRIGDVAVAQGDLAAARASFGAGLAIRERLAASDPGNSGWQRDLVISHAKVGQHAEAGGDIVGAIAAFTAAELIIARLAGRWPDHPGFAKDLANVRHSLNRLRGAGTP